MKKLFFLFFIATGTSVMAQEFAIKVVELTSDKVILHYDLIDTTKNRTYTIYVYSSKDNFLSPLTQVSGDAGIEVKPGTNKRIVWNSREELGAAFEGDVELEIRGRAYIPFIRLDGFDEVKSRKRAVPFLVKWGGGTQQNILNFQLYKNEKLMYTFPNVPNSHEYKLTIPPSVKPGAGYRLRISDTKNKEQQVNSNIFAIKRKFALALKALPILAIGGLTYSLIGKSGSSDLSGPPPVPGSH